MHSVYRLTSFGGWQHSYWTEHNKKKLLTNYSYTDRPRWSHEELFAGPNQNEELSVGHNAP